MATARSGHATYYLDVGLVSQNIAGNYSTLNVHIYAVADSGWSGNASGIGWSCYGGSGAFSFSGGSAEIANYNVNVGHDGNGYCNYSFTANVNATGTSTYGGPISWTQAGSLPRIPKPPGVPAISAAAPVGRNVAVTVSVPGGYDEGGSSVQTLEVVASLDGGAYGSLTTGGWGARTYSNLAPGSWKFAARAKNAYGYSGYAYSAAVVVRAGGKRWTGSAFTPTTIAKRATSPTTWTDLTIARRYDGSKWVDLS